MKCSTAENVENCLEFLYQECFLKRDDFRTKSSRKSSTTTIGIESIFDNDTDLKHEKRSHLQVFSWKLYSILHSNKRVEHL